jgi:hypothetical protein
LDGRAFNVAQIAQKTGLDSPAVARFFLLGVKRNQLLRFGKSGKYQYVVIDDKLESKREPRGAVCEIVYAILSKNPQGLSYEEIISQGERFCHKRLNGQTVQAIVRRWYGGGYAKRISPGVYALAAHVHSRPPTTTCRRIIRV